MKPFSIEAALTGDKVVCRDGSVCHIIDYNQNAVEGFNIVGWTDSNVLRTWSHVGKFVGSEEAHDYDIVGMAKKKETRSFFVNVYEDHTSPCNYETEQLADNDAQSDRIACIQFNYEVEV